MTGHTVVCGHCNRRWEDAGPLAPEHDCTPQCALCEETFDDTIAASRHDCPERSEFVPTPDRVPESERIERGQRRREEVARAEERRLGLR